MGRFRHNQTGIRVDTRAYELRNSWARRLSLVYSSVTMNSITQDSWFQNHMDSQQLKTTDICLRVLSQFGPKNFKASLKGEPLDMTDVS